MLSAEERRTNRKEKARLKDIRNELVTLKNMINNSDFMNSNYGIIMEDMGIVIKTANTFNATKYLGLTHNDLPDTDDFQNYINQFKYQKNAITNLKSALVNSLPEIEQRIQYYDTQISAIKVI
ncbi:MAG: hypothetical protein RR565_08850 [Erysipelothrix sp.]